MEIIRNKKAFFDYEILERFEAGMVLYGYEVKAVRNKKIDLKGSYVSLHRGEAWLENVHIGPYQPKNQPAETMENPKRKRKLLLNKKEIDTLQNQADVAGNTIIPLRVFIKNHRLKVEIGIGRGKKRYDKRETIKKRELDRSLRRGTKY